MQARMTNPALTVPGAMQALTALGKAAQGAGVDGSTLGLVYLRVSQINGCSVCVDMHARDLRKRGETDERLFGLAAWHDAPFFTPAERAVGPGRGRHAHQRPQRPRARRGVERGGAPLRRGRRSPRWCSTSP